MGLRAVPKPRQALPSAKPTLGKQKQSFPTTQFGPIRDIAFAPLTFSAFTILNRFYIFLTSDQPIHGWVPNQAVGNSSTTLRHYFPHSH